MTLTPEQLADTRRKDAEADATAICAQCESNTRWNETGGYRELAEKCRAYCRNGHEEQ